MSFHHLIFHPNYVLLRIKFHREEIKAKYFGESCIVTLYKYLKILEVLLCFYLLLSPGFNISSLSSPMTLESIGSQSKNTMKLN